MSGSRTIPKKNKRKIKSQIKLNDMNANELRIGNYFKWISTQDVDTVEEIVTYNKSTCDINSVSISDCEPIPLTEEWLEKFGLDQGGYDFYFWTKETPTGLFSINGDPDSAYGVRYNNEIEPPLKYVHQLQNLYFALTGEELTISE